MEAKHYYTTTCFHCSLRRRLAMILDDGTGCLAPALQPLADAIAGVAAPEQVMAWVGKPAVQRRLSQLATGEVPLTHDGIDTLEGPQGREYLRELLIDTGLLERRDKYLAAFAAWCPKRLASIEDEVARRDVEMYLNWRHMRDLRVRSEAGRLTATAANMARDTTDSGVRFLAFLALRGQVLAQARQEDLDEFFASQRSAENARDFITWAIKRRRCPKLVLPTPKRTHNAGCPPEQVAELAQRLLADESLSLGDRAAGLIVVLFAQPVTRVCALRTEHVREEAGRMLLELGPEPVEVPPPAASVIATYASDRWHMRTANKTSDWLFPGVRPGEHVIPMQMRHRLRQIGIDQSVRKGALDYLISEVPSAVVARVTGYNAGTTAARAKLAGGEWASYVRLKQAAGGAS
jgi:site-specific recombinase XerD